MPIHYQLLINPAAGSGNGQQTATTIIQELTKHNCSFTAHYTTYAGEEKVILDQLINEHLTPWSPEISDEQLFSLLVVIGGDGTLHQVVNHLDFLQIKLPLAYLPGGSGNDFARGAGISLDPTKALDNLLKVKQPQEITLIRYQEQVQQIQGLAISDFGIGLDAQIVQAANLSQNKKRLNHFHLGFLTYLLSALTIFWRQKGFPLLIQSNGKQYALKKALLCSVLNTPFFGGGLMIAPMASCTKKQLDLVLVERIAPFKLVYLLLKLLRKTHTQAKDFQHFSDQKLRIISTVPQLAQADGEIIAKGSFDFTLTLAKQQLWY
ncbi:MAG: diacylglycerol/lipid kinase family protein [Enterococcus sp.]